MIRENVDITGMTTFRIPAKARYFAEYESLKELETISRDPRFINGPVLSMGGGSNLLFVNDFDGLVLHSKIKGIKRYDKDDQTAFVICGAGEKWTDFVDWCIAADLAGVENMAGIPGEVGAAPVQNVGAYGREASDVIHTVECFDTVVRVVKLFSSEECQFGYRDSYFKHEGKGRYIVLRVSFKLRRTDRALHLDYAPLRDFAARLGRKPSIREIAVEVIRIRASKLPDPEMLGSAGSFFKNPVLREGYIKEIEALTGIRLEGHKIDEVHIKLSAASLIDKAGLKGKTLGGAEVYPKQPLVIVNQNNASASDVVELAATVESRVREKFMVSLSPEVNYIDTDIEVTILGSGTSKGVPEVGCNCRVCRSEDPKDKRLRTSALVRTMGQTILIDPSPDFRQQALKEGLHHIDAVLITHSHYDHVGGMDDLRPFCSAVNMPVYGNEQACNNLKKHYDYCFADHPYPGVPKFLLCPKSDIPFFVNGIKITPINVMHGPLPIFGYRIGKFAYITDAKTIEDSELDKLGGIEVLVLNALRQRDHFSHFTLKEAVQFISKVKPKRTYLTHFNHEIGLHEELSAQLPEGVFPAYDGATIKIS